MFGNIFGDLFGSGPAITEQQLSKAVDISQFSALALLKLYWQIVDEEYNASSAVVESLGSKLPPKNDELKLSTLTINNVDMESPGIFVQRVEPNATTFQLVQRYRLKSESTPVRSGFFQKPEPGPDHADLMDPRKDDCEPIILNAIREAVKSKLLPYFFARFVAKQISADIGQALETLRLLEQKTT